MAFGSVIDFFAAPDRLIHSLFTAFNQLVDYRIIWGYRGPSPMINIGSHIKISEWIPQIALLNHRRTRLFISHGGMKR